ncbi:MULTISPECIES: YlxR family protein [unclassified Janibacter]|uniref:YlxR family protein n=1 Tax=unclassified Janibacter TaxID=2649294 RepID=UPI003D07BD29
MTPVRTCIGCRRADSWSELLRVVAIQAEHGPFVLTPDPRHRLPGRGAWLHPTDDCLDLAVRRKAFSRALHLGGACEMSAVAAHVRALSTQQDQPS